MKKRTIVYVEPDDYFPKDIRKKYGLGEYAKPEKNEETVKKSEKEMKNRKTKNTVVNVDDLDIEAIEKKMAKMSRETASVLGYPEQKPLPTRNKRQMTFLTLRKYLSRIDRISMCMKDTLEYENFRCPADIPKTYDKMYVIGIGLAEVEFPDPDGDLCIQPCVEVMLSRTKD